MKVHVHLAALCLGVLAACSSTAAAESGMPTAETQSGTVSGAVNDGIVSYKGIPFAAPPTGALRWKAPQPPASWQGVRDATEYGAVCPQPERPDRRSPPVMKNQGEDCLTLNIWAPEAADNLPVMVWIHGGAHRLGSGAMPYYDGSAFAAQGVVLVTINYRLGLLGYFAHPALTAEAGGDDLIGNYGLMDQMAALQWVKDNIAGFGGDPSNVTVFGESAGGASTIYLLTAPAAHGLYDKAIVQSGGGFQQPDTLAVQEAKGIKAAQKAGLGPTSTAEELRALSSDDVLEMAGELRGLGFGSFIDGRLVKEAPPEAFAAGRVADVPLIIGANSNEASVMRTLGVKDGAVAMAAGASLPALRAAYDADAIGKDEFHRQVLGDYSFVAPAEWVARQTADGAPSYLYHFDYVAKRRRAKTEGAAHGSEIPYIFKSYNSVRLLNAFISAEDKAFAGMISSCWVNFARTGAPQCEGGPDWPAYGDADTLMLFAPETKTVSGFREAQMDVVTGLLEERAGLAAE